MKELNIRTKGLVKLAFDYEIGGMYNEVFDGWEEYLPETVDEAVEFIYECAIDNAYGPGYCGCGKAPREVRFAGKEALKAYIKHLILTDEECVPEIAEAKGWDMK